MSVWSARFLPSGRHVVTSGDDGTARVWPVDAEDVLALARRDLHPEARRRELAAKAELVGNLIGAARGVPGNGGARGHGTQLDLPVPHARHPIGAGNPDQTSDS
jgi:hypothetical protein